MNVQKMSRVLFAVVLLCSLLSANVAVGQLTNRYTPDYTHGNVDDVMDGNYVAYYVWPDVQCNWTQSPLGDPWEKCTIYAKRLTPLYVWIPGGPGPMQMGEIWVNDDVVTVPAGEDTTTALTQHFGYTGEQVEGADVQLEWHFSYVQQLQGGGQRTVTHIYQGQKQRIGN